MCVAQNGLPVYSDYFAENLFLLHPSMAGAAVKNQIRLTARQQWFAQQGAPNLQTVSFNGKLSPRSGFGVVVLNDANGYHAQVGGSLSYAYHLLFSRNEIDLNQLSLGLRAGFIQNRLDETQFNPAIFDPLVAGIIQRDGYLFFDVGFSYNYLDFSTHFTVKNVFFQSLDASQQLQTVNQSQYIFSAAYLFTRKQWQLEPSFLYSFRARTGQMFLDSNLKAFYPMDFGTLWGGLSYRQSFNATEYLDGSEIANQRLQYVTPVIGIRFQKAIFAYTYSYQIGRIQVESGGFHQITLGYNFGKRKERYSCNCPAVNY